jgi:hypothetical protein
MRHHHMMPHGVEDLLTYYQCLQLRLLSPNTGSAAVIHRGLIADR